MIPHIDRQPTKPNRRQIIPEDGSATMYATVAYADEPVDEGTLVNKAVLDEILSASGITTGTLPELFLAQEGFVLADGAPVYIRTHVEIKHKGITLNVQNTGNIKIIKVNGEDNLSIAANAWIMLIYSQPLNAYVAQIDSTNLEAAFTKITMTGTINMSGNYIDNALFR